MYYTFFKRSMRYQTDTSPPRITTDDIELDESDGSMFLKAEKMFYTYY